MTDHAFRRLEFDGPSHFKPHLTPKLLIPEIQRDISRRHGNLKSQSHARTAYGDFGGTSIQGEPIATFKIGEHFRFSTLANHVPSFAVMVRDARTRGDTDKYVKIHFRLCCIILTPEQRDDLIISIRRKDKMHGDRYHAFMAAHDDWLAIRKDHGGVGWPDYARDRKVISAQTYADMNATT